MHVIATDGLRAGYATGEVLQGVSIHVEEAEIVAVLGRNGVGKTTLMRALIGLLPARSGTIRFRGEDVTRLRADRRARYGIGYVPQGRDVFPHMNVIDNLRMGGFIKGLGGKPRLDLVHEYFPFLRERADQRAGTLSGGQQEMLAIGRALAGEPQLLLLDEPSDGVQPSIVHEIGDFVVELNRKQRLAVLIVEQNIDLVQKVASRAYVLDKGRVVRTLEKDEIRNTERLAEFLAI
ncbi:MAG TPA: ABC transporter ATP-binding protein [Stellaceae bacterium]|nr:ABC transporter ATP-binding protein [Stellaceae bacterium]